MSKRVNPEIEQDYQPKQIFAMCSNCKHRIKGKIVHHWYIGTQEENSKCGIGKFVVKKQGTCKLHERRSK